MVFEDKICMNCSASMVDRGAYSAPLESPSWAGGGYAPIPATLALHFPLKWFIKFHSVMNNENASAHISPLELKDCFVSFTLFSASVNYLSFTRSVAIVA